MMPMKNGMEYQEMSRSVCSVKWVEIDTNIGEAI